MSDSLALSLRNGTSRDIGPWLSTLATSLEFDPRLLRTESQARTFGALVARLAFQHDLYAHGQAAPLHPAEISSLRAGAAIALQKAIAAEKTARS